MSKYLVLTVLIIAVFFSGIYAASPNRETLTISGILKTPDGNFLNGNYSIDFNITNSNGTSVYDENHNGSQAPQVSVSNGYFSVTLGDTNVLPSNLFTGDFNLSVAVNSNGWMTPSMRLTAAANAVTASRALDFNVSNDLNVNRFLKIGSDLNVGNKLNVYDFNALYFRISSFFGSDLNAQYYRQSDANTVLMKKADMNSQYYTQTDANAVLVKQIDLNTFARTISGLWTFTQNLNVYGKGNFTDLNVQHDLNIYNDLNVIRDINVGRSITAVTYYGSGANLTGISADVNNKNISPLDVNVGRDLNVMKDANAENLRAIINLTLGSAIFNQNSALSAVTLNDDFNAAGNVSATDLNVSRKVQIGTVDATDWGNAGVGDLFVGDDLNVFGDVNTAGTLYVRGGISVRGSSISSLAAGSINLPGQIVSVGYMSTDDSFYGSRLSIQTSVGSGNPPLSGDANIGNNLFVQKDLKVSQDVNALRDIRITRDLNVMKDANAENLRAIINLTLGSAIFNQNSALSAVTLDDDLNVKGVITGWDLNASRNLLVGPATSGGLAVGDVNIYGSRIAFGSNQSIGGTKEIGFNSAISAITLSDDLNAAGTISGLDLNAFRNILIGTLDASPPKIVTYNINVGNTGAVTLNDDFNAAGTITGWDLNSSRDANIARNLKVNGILYGNGSGLTGITPDVNGKSIGPSDINANNIVLGSNMESGMAGLARGDANILGAIYIGAGGASNSGAKLTYDTSLFANTGFGKTGALSITDDLNIGGSVLATDINSVGTIKVGTHLLVSAATDLNQMRVGYGHRSTSPSLDVNLLRIFSPTATSASHAGLLIEGDILAMAMPGLTGNNDVNFIVALGTSAMAIAVTNRKSYLNGGQALDINLVTGNNSAGNPSGSVNVLGDLNVTGDITARDGNFNTKNYLKLTSSNDSNLASLSYENRYYPALSTDINWLVLKSLHDRDFSAIGTYHSGLFIQGDYFGMAIQTGWVASDFNFGINLGASSTAVNIFNNKSPNGGGQALDLNLTSGNRGAGAINIKGDLNIASQADNRVMWIDGNMLINGTGATGPAWYTCNVSTSVWTCTAI